jgi:hypothetical protein
MSTTLLQPVVEAVLRLAKRQGYILTRDIRSELRSANLPEKHWKEIVALTRTTLVYRQGRYYHKDSLSPRLEKELAQQHAIQKVIRKLIKHHRRHHEEDERRGRVRVDFIHPVKVRTEDGREYTLVSRDLSATGIRLLGTKHLLGQKVQLELPVGEGQSPCRILTRILWTCAIADDMFENGGSFLELLD